MLKPDEGERQRAGRAKRRRHSLRQCKARIALVGVLVASGAQALPAQERPAGGARTLPAAKKPVAVVSVAAEPESSVPGERASPPLRLSTAQRADIFREALGRAVLRSADIGQGIRLTPSQPFLPGKGRLALNAPWMVEASSDGGLALLMKGPQYALGSSDIMDPSPGVPAVICFYYPAVVNQPLLIDISVRTMQDTKIRLRVSSQYAEVFEIASGSHHLVTIVKPADLEEKRVVVTYAGTQGTGLAFTFFACEITPLKQ